MSIKSQVENGSQDSVNSQEKPSAEGEGVNHAITSETKGLSFLLAYMLAFTCVFSIFWGLFWLCGKGGDYEHFLLESLV